MTYKIKVAGRWRDATYSFTKISGVWKLVFSGAPKAPILMSCVSTKPGRVDLAWMPPAQYAFPVEDVGDTIKAYFVESSVNGTDWVQQIQTQGTDLSTYVDGLPAVKTSFRVIAQGSNAKSAPSNVLGVTPMSPAPVLAYTADGQFTINNYVASYTYLVTGATRNGNLLTGVANGATITAAGDAQAVPSNRSTMNVLNNGRILDPTQSYTSTGCGPRGDLCCPGGQIINAGGAQCGGAPGSFISDPGQAAAFCNGQCDDNCWQLTIQCYSYHYPDYSGDGYKLIGQTWGKATNG